MKALSKLLDCINMKIKGMEGFILIDPTNNNTIAAGMIVETSLPRLDRNNMVDQARGMTVWLTGLSGSGKTTIAEAVYARLLANGIRAQILDADAIRKHLNGDLSFSKKDRDENVRRIGFIADLLARHGVVVLVAAISPYRVAREQVRQTTNNFMEVYVSAPLSVCEERDPKGLYQKARSGKILNFTGIDDPYEEPLTPDIRLNTHEQPVKASVDELLQAILLRSR